MEDLRKSVILGFVFLAMGLTACGEKTEDDRKKTTDLVTIRTLGLAYLEENNLAEAEAEFRKLIELAPDEALGYANLGLVYLRMADYERAETQLKRALEISPRDPEIRLNLAEIYELTQRGQEAIAVLTGTLESHPDHMKTLYKLAQIHGRAGENQDLAKAETYLNKLSTALPANIAVRLQLIETLLRRGRADEATRHTEELQQQMPELPKESIEYFRNALASMKAGNTDAALNQALIFHNYMKVTAPYQAGLAEVRTSSGPLSGSPVLTFSRDISQTTQSQSAILEALRFTDATESAGLEVMPEGTPPTAQADVGAGFALADFDRDGDQDIYYSVWQPDANQTQIYLFRNEFGRFVDIAAEAGIQHGGRDQAAIFADYDNDGFLDLFVRNTEQNRLYRNVAEGKFQDQAIAAGVAESGTGAAVEFMDVDHDGDLDLYLPNSETNQLFRNNGDGTFTELSERMGLTGAAVRSRDIGFADFDNDVDLDIVVVNTDGGVAYFRNLRRGYFDDVAQQSGIAAETGSGTVAIGDYNNDGFQDLFLGAFSDGPHRLYRNKGDGTFEQDNRSQGVLDLFDNVQANDARFFDFDNDGFLDLLLAGTRVVEPTDQRAVFLLRNDGTGTFEDRSDRLPADLRSATRVSVADYNEDGDMDIFLTDTAGRLRLLRNDGGNANKYLKIQLVGLRTGSGKNNHYGIGAKIEVRAGDLYQTRVVDGPVSHFGLGQRLKAEVVRILWTNGVPENLFFPGSDQDIVEQQTLKGSCAFVYAWNGERFEFVTDVMWRSALGMPLGIMGGETTYAPTASSNDYFRISGDKLKAKDGVYALQLTEELWETAYFDKLRLVAVDHQDNIEVYINERLTPERHTPLRIYTVAEKWTPKSATDDQGNELLSVIRDKDHQYVATFSLGPYQGLTEMHDLILDLNNVSYAKELYLFLNGWIFPTDASINVALSQSQQNRVTPPFLQVPDQNGNWRTVIDDISFPMGKDKTVIVELTNRFLSDDHRVRIRTNMQIYWDQVFCARDQNASIKRTELVPNTADLHYRGFSRLYRKGGRYGPHWFDYHQVSTEPKWRDLIGKYTRYGEVNPLLLESDNRYVIMNAGDEMTVRFDVSQAPPLPEGWTRTFLIYTDGWIKDGDLNTAHGKTVEPLPFHEMTGYPYGPTDAYPEDPSLKEYLRRYNTRDVNNKGVGGLSLKQ